MAKLLESQDLESKQINRIKQLNLSLTVLTYRLG